LCSHHVINLVLYSRARVRPSRNVTFHYGSHDAGAEESVIDVAHVMKYPSVMLEDIDAITKVDCSASSVALTFSNSSTFAYTREIWVGKFIIVTNHMGDCDVELERGVFIVDSLHFDEIALVITAHSQMTDVSSVAGKTNLKTSAGLKTNKGQPLRLSRSAAFRVPP